MAPLRLLLVDDDELFLEASAATLTRDERIDVVGRARDGAQAVDLAGALRPDIVLMDIDMPVMDGIEATAAIVRATLARRVVVVTSSDSDADRELANDAGASGYLRKDAALPDLAETLVALLP